MLNKNISPMVIEALSHERSQIFYLKPVGYLTDTASSGQSSNDSGNSSGLAREKNADNRQTVNVGNPESLHDNETGLPSISQMSVNILQAWLSLKVPFLFQGEIYSLVGINSGSGMTKVTKELVGSACINIDKLPIVKQTASVWIPLERAFEYAGIKKPVFHSKGGWVHQFVAHRTAKALKSQGFLVDLEFMLQNNKSVDAIARNDLGNIVIEFAMTPPATKELNNIHKDLATDFKPDLMIVTAKDKKMKQEIEKLVADDKDLYRFKDRISVMLVGNLIKNGIPEKLLDFLRKTKYKSQLEVRV